jgi:hypothetical protein
VPGISKFRKEGHPEGPMDFDLTDEQKDIIKAAREFAEKKFPDVAQECDREEKSPRHLWEEACQLGFVGVFTPKTYGGAGLGYLEHCLINEEFWRVDPGIAHFVLAGTFGSGILLLFGTEEQKKKWVPPLVAGKAIIAAAITEPDAGSDVSSVRTKARDVDNRLQRQYEAIERGNVSNCDVSERIRELKVKRDHIDEQLQRVQVPVNPPNVFAGRSIEDFQRTVKDLFLNSDRDFTKRYLKLFIDRITITGRQVRIEGKPAAVLAAMRNKAAVKTGVLTAVNNWLPGQDSNLQPSG